MKKITFAVLLASIILIASCKKSSNADSTGQWAFAGHTYNASGATFSKADSALSAGSSEGSLTVYFPSASVQTGSYLIVNYDSIPLHIGQVYIRFIDDATSQYYFSTGQDNINAAVTVSAAGKVNISIPAVYLQSYSNPVPYTDQLTATISSQ